MSKEQNSTTVHCDACGTDGLLSGWPSSPPLLVPMHPATGVGGLRGGFAVYCSLISVCRSERNGCVTRWVLRSCDKNLLDRQTGEAEDDPVERRRSQA